MSVLTSVILSDGTPAVVHSETLPCDDRDGSGAGQALLDELCQGLQYDTDCPPAQDGDVDVQFGTVDHSGASVAVARVLCTEAWCVATARRYEAERATRILMLRRIAYGPGYRRTPSSPSDEPRAC
ncbi:hypothetical protein P8605_04785 [Streptomyces sp. T-3]|nr:hypothetical protein [Streptomyces sp. T-3]